MEDRQKPLLARHLPIQEADGLLLHKKREDAGSGVRDSRMAEPAARGRLCVPIVFCADAHYGAYCAVILQSVLNNAATGHEYRIIIFDCGIKRADLDNLARQIAPHENFHLEIHNISAYLQENRKAFCVLEGQHLSPAAYGRLFIPRLCGQYDKVIYADIDMIFNRDPAVLLQRDLEENYIAGVVDSNIEEERFTRAGIKKYSREVLGLRDDQAYINSGLLVFHNRIWRDKRLMEQCLAILSERQFKRHDQDMINFICKGKIHYLDAEWNSYCKLYRFDDKAEAAEEKKMAAIIHFIGSIKPWHSPTAERGALWWVYARKTAVYDRFLQEALANKAGLNLGTGQFDYSLFGLPAWQVKVSPKKKKYSLFGLAVAKEKINSKKQKKAFYLFGLKIFSRRLGRDERF